MKLHRHLYDSLALNDNTAKANKKTTLAFLFNDFQRRMSGMDPQGTPRVLEAMRCYLANYDSQDRNNISNIEEYIEYRIQNVGFWYDAVQVISQIIRAS